VPDRDRDARAAYDRWRASWPASFWWPDWPLLRWWQQALFGAPLPAGRVPCVLCAETPGWFPDPAGTALVRCPGCGGTAMT
jgi:hypothetical protein